MALHRTTIVIEWAVPEGRSDAAPVACMLASHIARLTSPAARPVPAEGVARHNFDGVPAALMWRSDTVESRYFETKEAGK